MTIQDRIYGTIRIEDPFIIALINSTPMQRIKGISQDGATHFVYPLLNVTRFEHCVGVWYLSTLFHRPLEEQAACLLHDVPHTAFSHVVDFLMDKSDQDYHEQFLEKIIYQSEIPEICKEFGIDLAEILHTENFALLDNHTPELSFDRWDYFMRDGYTFGILPHDVIQLILSSVKEKNDTLYFLDARIAGLFSIMTMQIGRLMYLDPTSTGTWHLLANALKIALEGKCMTEDDLFKTDEEVLQILRQSHESRIHSYLDRLTENRSFHYTNKETAEFSSPNKARYVDPKVLQNGQLIPLSEIVPGIKDYIAEYKDKASFISVTQE